MGLPAGVILEQAADTLQDSGNARWPEAELLRYLSEAQRAAVLLRPEVHLLTVNYPLVVGARQGVPQDGHALIEVTRNMGSQGNAPGRTITPTRKDSLDQSTPDWPCAAASCSGAEPGLINFIHDVRNRKAWYAYPSFQDTAALENWNVEMIYVGTPARLTTVDEEIVLDDNFEPALINYVLFKAVSKDIAAETQSAARAQTHLNAFTTLLLGREEDNETQVQVRQQIVEGNNNRADPSGDTV